MKSLLAVVFAAALAIGAAATARAGEASPPPPDQGPVYVTTYFEVSPQNAMQALQRLREYRDAARAEPGVIASEILQETGTPSRFVTNEVVRDWAAYEEHIKAAPRTRLFVQMRGMQWGPPDTRTHLLHASVPDGGTRTANSVIILSHLDVTPSSLPRLIEIMRPLVEGTARDAGVQRFQILRQAPGTGNHFRLYEIWANERAWDAHNAQAHVIEFRNDLQPMLGTPYDQRRYTIVD